MPSVIHVASTMTKAAKHLAMPVFVTEQRPDALGTTVSELKADLDAAKANVFQKSKFSMCTPELMAALLPATESVILCGLEAHVCVQQTALDLLERGIDVHLLVDGVSSMRQYDRVTALKRLTAVGAHVTTCESALFELLRDARHPQFKAISTLAKSHAAARVDPLLPEASL